MSFVERPYKLDECLYNLQQESDCLCAVTLMTLPSSSDIRGCEILFLSKRSSNRSKESVTYILKKKALFSSILSSMYISFLECRLKFFFGLLGVEGWWLLTLAEHAGTEVAKSKD